jgi:hypothetical protein
VLDNEGFWNNCHHKVSEFFDKVKETNRILKNLFGKKNKDKNKAKNKDSSVFSLHE